MRKSLRALRVFAPLRVHPLSTTTLLPLAACSNDLASGVDTMRQPLRVHPLSTTTLLLLLAACSKPPATPANHATADTGHDVGIDAPTNTTTAPADRELVRRVAMTPAANRLEDPDFTFQNESWFAVDPADELVRVRRIYEPRSPDNRPVAGIIGEACLVGRMKWGDGAHMASVWIGRTTGDAGGAVTPDLLGLRLSPSPAWFSTPLVDTGETLDLDDGRTWTRFETSANAHYGWGYFEVCSTASTTVFVGAPVVTSMSDSNALLRAAVGRPATAAQQRRIAIDSRRR